METKQHHELYEKARKRTKQKRRLYVHLILFIIGSVFLFILNTVLGFGAEFGNFWFYTFVGIWFILWILHFVNVFFTNKFFGKDWERKETDKLIQKHQKKVKKLEKKLLKNGTISKKIEEKSENTEEEPQKNVTLIAVVDYDNGLGKDNELLCHMPADLKRFKELTSGHHIIMGRKTFDSIGKPLPNRTNIIITRNKKYKQEGCEVVYSLEEALELVKNDDSPFIVGGAEIYNQAISIADKLEITYIHHLFEADAFFPEIDSKIWIETSRTLYNADDKNEYEFSFVTYLRK